MAVTCTVSAFMASGSRHRQLRPLHALAALIHIQPRRWEANDVRSRRRLQRRNLLQQVVEEQDEFEWIFKPTTAPKFWRSLRWGGPGVLIGFVLAKLSSGS